MNRHPKVVSVTITRIRKFSDQERLAFLRIIIGSYATLFCLVRLPHLWNTTSYPQHRWESIGVLSWLHDAPAPWIFRSILIVCVASGIVFVSGRYFRLTGPVFALTFLAISTFRFSWGSVLHTEHLLIVHVLIIGFSAAGDAFVLQSKNQRQPTNATQPKDYMWAIHIAALATVIGYFVSGVAKVRYGGWDWITGDVLRNQIAFDNVRKIILGDVHSPFAGWIIRNPVILTVSAPVTVILELGAPLALLHRRIRNIWVTGVWLFHVGVLVFMAILFPYQLLAIAYIPLFMMTPLLPKHSASSESSHVPEQARQRH
jgi:hypothetical protein